VCAQKGAAGRILNSRFRKAVWQVVMEDDSKKLDEILTVLRRIEERQIKTTAMVSEVKEHEAPVVGSFGSMDSGEK